MSCSSWDEALRRKARAIHAEIAALHRYVAEEPGLPPAEAAARIEAMAASHYAMLDDLYLRQVPFARAAAGSDLFLNYRGAAAPAERAGIAAVDRLFGTVRTQLGALAQAVAASHGAEKEKADAAPALTVSAYAPGLYAGFALPDDPGAETALRQGLRCLGAAAQALALPQDDPDARLAGEIDDPQVRDTTLGALKKFLPARDKAVDAIEIRGRATALAAPALFDRAAWQVASRLMAQPVGQAGESGEAGEKAAFAGDLLQIDYELLRFELRGVEGDGFRSLRCAYPAALAAECEGLARRRVEVRGTVALRNGRPRLLQVEAIRAIF